jgi:pyruvate/2-oxoglutarate dehydrogenase complex dihydrolipoamide dehydrogenase (E3) component
MMTVRGSGRHAARRRIKAYDLVILGAGPAGIAAADLAARLGARVALLERDRLGGTSVNTGSVPSKALIRGATLFAGIREASRLMRPHQRAPIADFQRVAARLRAIEERIAGYQSLERLQRAGIEVFFGAAQFLAKNVLASASRHLQFKHALVATGARPAQPRIRGLSQGSYVTSDTIFALEKLPEHLAVVGGGALGCELAQSICRLSSRDNHPGRARFLPGRARRGADPRSGHGPGR